MVKKVKVSRVQQKAAEWVVKNRTASGKSVSPAIKAIAQAKRVDRKPATSQPTAKNKIP